MVEKVRQVKYALKSIVSELRERDRLTVITFTSCAQQVLPFTLMTARRRRRVLDGYRALTLGQGSLWERVSSLQQESSKVGTLQMTGLLYC